MARIQIGTIAHRRPDGTFMPSKPIHRDVPGDEVADKHIPYGEVAEIFADKYDAFLQAQRLRNESST